MGKRRKKKATLKGKRMDLIVGGDTLQGEGMNLVVGGKKKKLKGKGFTFNIENIDRVIERIESMPPGEVRDDAWQAVLDNLKQEVTDLSVSLKGKKKKGKNKPKIEAFHKAIRKEGLQSPDPEDVKALERLLGGKLKTRVSDKAIDLMSKSKTLVYLPDQPSTDDRDRIRRLAARADRIIDLKFEHDIPVSKEEKDFITPMGKKGKAPDLREGLPPAYKKAVAGATGRIVADPEPGENLSQAQDAGRVQKRVEPEAISQAAIASQTGIEAMGKRLAAPVVGTGSLAYGVAKGVTDIATGEKNAFADMPEIQRRQEHNLENKSFLQRVGGDLFDVVESGANLLYTAMGDPFAQEPQDLEALAARNTEIGSKMVSGFLGEAGAILDDPVQSFTANPVMTAIVLAPLTGVAKNFVASDAGQAALRAMKGAADVVGGSEGALAGMHLHPQQVARLTGLAKLHDSIVAPVIQQIQEVAGHRIDTQLLFKAIVDESRKKGDQLRSIGNRLHNVIDRKGPGDNRFENLLLELEDALPTQEALAADFGRIKQQAFGHDELPGRPGMFEPHPGVGQPVQQSLDFSQPKPDFAGERIKPGDQAQLAQAQERGAAAFHPQDTLLRPDLKGPQPPGAQVPPPQQGFISKGFEPPGQRPELPQSETAWSSIHPKEAVQDKSHLQPASPSPQGPGAASGQMGLPVLPKGEPPRTPGEVPVKLPKKELPEPPVSTEGGSNIIFQENIGGTNIAPLPVPNSRWGLAKNTPKILEELRNPLKQMDVLKKAQDIARAEQEAMRHHQWQQTKPLMIQKANNMSKVPYAVRPLSETAKRFLGEIDDILVPTAFDRAVTFRAWTESPPIFNGVWKMNQYMKKAQTVWNIASGFGNYLSNLFMTSIGLNTNPMSVAGGGILLNSQWKKWILGEDITKSTRVPDALKNESLIGLFRRSEEKGLMDSTPLIDVELGSSAALFGDSFPTAVAGGAAMGGVIAGPLGAGAGAAAGPLLMKIAQRWPLKNVLKAQTDFYRFGDNGFKLYVAWDEFNRHLDDVDLMGSGRYKTIATEKGPIKITKMEGDRWLLNDVRAEKAEVMNTLYDAGIHKAQNLFFDYRDSPMHVDFMRGLPLLSLLSPFQMWSWKALDIPGLKKGLISRTFEMPGKGVTNDPRLASKMFRREVGISIKRSFVINGMRHQQSEHRDEFRRWLAFSPTQPRAILMRLTTSPLWIEADDIEQYNWMQPGMTLLRQVDGLLNGAPSEKDILDHVKWVDSLDDLRDSGFVPDFFIKLSQDMVKKQIKLAKNKFTFGDVLSIFGVGGSLWSETFKIFEDEAEQGRAIDPSRLYSALSTALIGGGLSKALKLTLGLADPDTDAYLISGFSERDSQMEKIRESVFRFGVRGILGLGFRPQFIGEKEDRDDELAPRMFFGRGMQRAKNILKQTMLGSYKKKIERLMRLNPANPLIETYQDVIDVGQNLIDQEIDNWLELTRGIRDDYEEVYKRQKGTKR